MLLTAARPPRGPRLPCQGMRDSRAYVVNGVGILVMWLLGRILLFLASFLHIYRHWAEVRQVKEPSIECMGGWSGEPVADPAGQPVAG